MIDMLIASGLGPVCSDPEGKAGAARLPFAVQKHIGAQLQATYLEIVVSGAPQHLLDLTRVLESALAPLASERDAAFRAGLTAALPALQVFAQSLAGSAARADDLVQEAVLKAWANQDRFVPGTNLKAWLFTILRNHFYTERRKHRREVEDVDGVMAGQLVALAAQEHGSDLQVVLSYIARLPAPQREALLLVGAQGLTYEAAAEVMGCQTGTVKSRVSRARSYLMEQLSMSSTKVPA
ncbi:RNA polymerase sigma-70 factor (ECF subfamily) [Methylobacterium sp. RAS18]|nr:RNA polymerase sigma-70 factor (ECF subfamily) [Methylobacterium sp. RAS18]MCP1561316.1 RNA polymerase sigma-70 factor (ECF subfamily) [Methylorubrum extorquens]MDF9861517.1 RNA polymerase sigma-70 factor (ECF subfamily) [Methylorubrum pseudosasae]MDH6635142.1 RNA polymerase sigma-70 factor (ECF subfamily) [Methylobacterium sp. SuP10 SLI 274]MDH6664315.1 RNA polymerase sigma-70 factor (ECF subfamily) [Methylorubrum zatmanii]